MVSQGDELSHFKDRERSIGLFDGLWLNEQVKILNYFGFPGVGKSSLIDWLVTHRCKHDNIPFSVIDFRNRYFAQSYRTLLDTIFEHHGMSTHLPVQALDDFHRKRDEIVFERNDRRISTQISQVQSNTSQSRQYVSLNLKEALLEIDRQARDDISNSWIKCLATVKHPKVVLFFDTYENYDDLASRIDRDWLWNMIARTSEYIRGLRFIVASREPIDRQYRNLDQEPLENLSREDTDELLVSLGVDDDKFRSAVYHGLSGGHPLITRFAAEAWHSTDGQKVKLRSTDVPDVDDLEQAVEWVIREVIQRLREPLKSAMLWAALLRSFNLEVLNAILPVSLAADEFKKLISYSIVEWERDTPRWSCHSLIQKTLSKYLKTESPNAFIDFHRRAATYYEQVNDHLEASYHYLIGEMPDEAARVLVVESNENHLIDTGQSRSLLHHLGRFSREHLPSRLWSQLCSTRGRAYRIIGDFHNSIEAYFQAIDTSKDTDHLDRAKFFCGLAETYRMLGEYGTTISSYQAAADYATRAASDEYEAQALCGIGRAMRLMGEYKGALAAYDEAINKSSTYDRQGLQIEAIWGRSRTLLVMGQNRKAMEGYKRCEELAANLPDKYRRGEALWGIAEVHRAFGEYDAAITVAEQGLEILETLTTPYGTAWYYVALADAYRLKGKLSEAEEKYREAKQICIEIGDRFGVTVTELGLAEVFRLRGESDTSLSLFESGKKWAYKVNHPLEIAHARLGILETQRIAGQADFQDYNILNKVYRRLGCQWGVIHCLIGKAISRLPSWAASSRILRNAEELCDPQENPSELRLIWQIRQERSMQEIHPLNFPW